MPFTTDVLIIGAGIAGATAALRLAREAERRITLITRARKPRESNTLYAQGGIAARGRGDSAGVFAADILRAGAGLSDPGAVRRLAEEGPPLVYELLAEELGVPFVRHSKGGFAYARGGGHALPRLLHVRDATGRAIETALIAALRALPNVTLLTSHTAVDLIRAPGEAPRCLGAYVLEREGGEIHRYLAPVTVLATGGLSNVYLHSSNPKGARGDGVAMAHRAGLSIANAEYVQFHPTTLAPKGGYNFLISEAVRGEGARLRTPDGRLFMEAYADQGAEMAPRDVVARAIHRVLVAHDYPHVLLDLASVLEPEHIQERFPAIVQMCRRVGIDATTEPIPVVPAAHYFCGGIPVDDRGRTALPGLYAVGEVSCTGVHGANRLAGVSLLEGLLWGHRAAGDIAALPAEAGAAAEVSPWRPQVGRERADPASVQRDVETLQVLMWRHVGLVREASGLQHAVAELAALRERAAVAYAEARLDDDLIALRNMVEAALLVARAALANPRSRGAHYRT